MDPVITWFLYGLGAFSLTVLFASPFILFICAMFSLAASHGKD